MGQIRLPSLIRISEPIFYGDSVYKFKRIVGKPNLSDQFKKINKRYIKVVYNLDVMRQPACLVFNPRISEPIFYGYLVYKIKRIVGKPNLSDQFKKTIKRYKKVGYNLDIMRQSACLV